MNKELTVRHVQTEEWLACAELTHPFESAVDLRYFADQPAHCAMLCQDDANRCYGFIIYELFDDRIDVLRLVVDYKLEAEGEREIIFRKLLDRLFSKLYKQRPLATMVIRETDINFQKLLARCNWKGRKVIRNFFEDTGEDGFMFTIDKTE